MATAFFFLIGLLFSHFICDYTHLSRPYMLKAKSIGSPILPIAIHALYHTAGIAVVIWTVLVYCRISITMNMMIAILLLEFASHALIDLLKGKCNVWFPKVKDTSKYMHWYIFGLDQLLHQIVIVYIWFAVLMTYKH